MSATQSRTAALDALEGVLKAAIEAKNATFHRDPEHSVDASHEGVAIMTDGDPGEPEVLLSPISFSWEHQVEIEITASGEERRATVEALISAINAAVAADATLGGTVDDARIMSAPETHEFGDDGVETERSAVLNVQLAYTTASAAG